MFEPVTGTQAHAHWLTGWQMGRDDERTRILVLVDNQLCMDNRTNGVCEHGYCYELNVLQAAIQGMELRDE